MSKRNRRKQRQAQQRTPQTRTAQKDYGTFWGAGTSGLFTGAGVSGRNTNLTRTEWGAATAYQIVPEVNRAISLRSAAISALNWEIVKKDKDGNEVVLCTQEDTQPEHPLARAFNATYDYSNQSMIALMAYSHDLVGEVFVQKTWTEETGRGLFWLNPLGTEPIIAGRIVSFQYTSMDGAQSESLKPNEVAYYHNRSPYSNFRGLGLTQVVMQKINMARNLDDFIEDFFNNNARPSVLVSPQGDMPFTDQQITQLQQQLDNFLKGRGNNWSTYVSKIGAKYTPMDQPNVGDHYTIAPILSRYIYTVYGVPLAIAGDDSGTQYKTGDDVQVAFYQNTIIPLARELAKYINTQIMPYFDNSGAFFRFDTSEFDLVSADDDLRSQIATRNFLAGLWTRNKALEYQKETDIPAIDFMLIEGGLIPIHVVPEYWKYKLTVSPATELAPVVGTDIGVEGAENLPPPEPAQPAQLPAGESAIDIEPAPTQISGKATQTNAADELRAWEKKTTKNWKAKFEPLHTKGALSDTIEYLIVDSNGDMAAIKSAFEQARSWLADSEKWTDERLSIAFELLYSIKAYADTRKQFVDDMLRIIDAGQKDESTRRKFAAEIRSVLRKYGLQAYRDGMNEVGYDPESLSKKEFERFRNWQDEQSGYVTKFGAEVFKMGITPDEVSIRANMWADVSLRGIYLGGITAGNGQQRLEWKLGKAERHCPDCLVLNGQVHTADEWEAKGLRPGNGMTICKQGCDCDLVTTDKKTVGNYLG